MDDDQKEFKEDLTSVFKGILDNARQELLAKTEVELESYWYFKYDPQYSKEWNLYEFNKCLDLYRSSCRKWEEHHNGHCCVVERVRDKYLMPKIKDFLVKIGV